jgi:hypothetical protein
MILKKEIKKKKRNWICIIWDINVRHCFLSLSLSLSHTHTHTHTQKRNIYRHTHKELDNEITDKHGMIGLISDRISAEI